MSVGRRGVHEGWRCCSDEVHYAILASFPVLRLSSRSGNPLPHSGMLSLDLDTCDCQEGIEMMNTCIEKEWITWHAFPHVAELEIMDEQVLCSNCVLFPGLRLASVFTCPTSLSSASTRPSRTSLVRMMYFYFLFSSFSLGSRNDCGCDSHPEEERYSRFPYPFTIKFIIIIIIIIIIILSSSFILYVRESMLLVSLQTFPISISGRIL